MNGAFCIRQLWPYQINMLKNPLTLKPGSVANLDGFVSVIHGRRGFCLKLGCIGSAWKQRHAALLPSQAPGGCATPSPLPCTPNCAAGTQRNVGAELGGMWAVLLAAGKHNAENANAKNPDAGQVHPEGIEKQSKR